MPPKSLIDRTGYMLELPSWTLTFCQILLPMIRLTDFQIKRKGHIEVAISKSSSSGHFLSWTPWNQSSRAGMFLYSVVMSYGWSEGPSFSFWKKSSDSYLLVNEFRAKKVFQGQIRTAWGGPDTDTQLHYCLHASFSNYTATYTISTTYSVNTTHMTLMPTNLVPCVGFKYLR